MKFARPSASVQRFWHQLRYSLGTTQGRRTARLFSGYRLGFLSRLLTPVDFGRQPDSGFSLVTPKFHWLWIKPAKYQPACRRLEGSTMFLHSVPQRPRPMRVFAG